MQSRADAGPSHGDGSSCGPKAAKQVHGWFHPGCLGRHCPGVGMRVGQRRRIRRPRQALIDHPRPPGNRFASSWTVLDPRQREPSADLRRHRSRGTQLHRDRHPSRRKGPAGPAARRLRRTAPREVHLESAGTHRDDRWLPALHTQRQASSNTDRVPRRIGHPVVPRRIRPPLVADGAPRRPVRRVPPRRERLGK